MDVDACLDEEAGPLLGGDGGGVGEDAGAALRRPVPVPALPTHAVTTAKVCRKEGHREAFKAVEFGRFALCL